MEILYEIHNRLVEDTPIGFKRYLYHKINWDSRLVEITGARGVGKTTLILQYIKSTFNSNDTSVLYFSADDPYFYSNSIVDTVDKFVKYGGSHIFIDEVHKYLPKHNYTDWSGEMKAIYDRYPKLKIVYSGSSIIQLMKGSGDLSRRISPYFLSGLSFREYLWFNGILELKELSLDDILKQHLPLAKDISSKTLILPHFQKYLKFGYYPFYNQDKEKYYDRLKNVINVILDVDIPSVIDIQYQSVQKIKRLLAVISTSSPYTPNLTELGKKIGITDQRTLLKYLDYMEKAALIRNLRRDAIGDTILRKPDKIYISNTNLAHALELNNVNTGTIRETFLYSQTNSLYGVKSPVQGDFKLNDKFIIEVGGKNKKSKQIINIDNLYLAIDDIETGIFNRIPLWLFGFLY
ncbi:MAG: hypothetical protein B6D61_12695 [Bacteroidetes bacterium 4484_249]|nr:MAG: hypothetical protein B6D61_12695 [Bacteroidetes bacterium 4484_249]